MKNGPKMLEGPEWLVDYGGLETFQNFQDLPPVIPNSIKPSQIQLDQV
jgi:nitrate reductase cytochrome c-type subunit